MPGPSHVPTAVGGMAGKVPEYCKQNIMGHSDGTMEGQSERTCGQEGLCSGGLMVGNQTPEGTRLEAFHATHWQIIYLCFASVLKI